MNDSSISEAPHIDSRRAFLQRNAMGIGSVALAWLLNQDQAHARKDFKEAKQFSLAAKPPSAPARATAMISLFQHGGPSHVDLFDPKPTLSKLDGTEYADDVKYSFVNRASKRLFGSPWTFKQHGECGTPVSELLPYTAKIVDKIAVLRSMHTGANGHEVSIRYFHGGIPGVVGRPHFGSWLTYALGAETQSLPAYMVLSDPGGHPVDGVNNWSNGFLPSLYQGTVLHPKEPRIANLDAPPHLRGLIQRSNLDFLRELNARHAKAFPAETDLEARISSYELAATMQTSAREALDISSETQATRRLYGIDRPATRDYGTRCLIARRLVERGVRFVQLFHNSQPWDNHSTIQSTLPSICEKTDQPSAALVTDLEQRGLLETTIVHWGGEIGRLPVTEDHGDPKKKGRDHNGQGFTIWMAGGGIRGGITYGETDEVGHRAVVDRVTPNDYQATLLHLFGLDHRELAFEHGGQKHVITANRESRIVRDILS